MRLVFLDLDIKLREEKSDVGLADEGDSVPFSDIRMPE